ncbi:ribonuclease HI family protein [Undibacterium jejuense]|uniref:Ribonuclease HI family protein n=1 Tax=Undibacterium jejuense TaxID=1344949 RepID=A0A923HAE9_9BURK|nr:ribonuclease HI family protein [Undibacterium jejuense]MBC3860752.1 ribonuclease HI family protein [Undibacterium jejuense]
MSKQLKNADLFADADWLAWFDGSAKPNPGTCRLACILKGKNGEHFSRSQHIGYGDSSDAEYQALIAALTLIKQHVNPSQAESVLLRGDSQVVIHDVLGPEAKASARLVEYRQKAQALLSLLPAVRLKWIPRHKNTEVDALMRNNIDIKN